MCGAFFFLFSFLCKMLFQCVKTIHLKKDNVRFILLMIRYIIFKYFAVVVAVALDFDLRFWVKRGFFGIYV